MKYSSDPEDWYDIETELEEERRYSHGEACRNFGERSGDYRGRLFVKRTSKGWEWYCHNCGTGGTKRYSAADLSRLYCGAGGSIESLQGNVSSRWPFSQKNSTAFGEEFVYPQRSSFTNEGLGWLRKYGITDEEIDRYGIYQTQEYGGRVVMPILSLSLPCKDTSPMCGFQLRRLQGERDQAVGPKYITRIKKGVTNARFRVFTGSNDMVLVVEDILSAIKGARVCSSLALLGSPNRFPDPLALELEERFEEAVIWLDPDKLKTSTKYADRLSSLYDVKVRVISTDKDPKDYSTEELAEILGI